MGKIVIGLDKMVMAWSQLLLFFISPNSSIKIDKNIRIVKLKSLRQYR